ncbi:uroporphyrin-III C-methyltransferase [Aneurinibacillus thermoaerophilus]|uniref:Uroporphyrinogen-III C-methyltransferase n=1 Tax=Aneurinibacillus thermoaerophilus TaxID=143495 RepID=A0A1G8A6B0_ANETH|nr:MULTISPECIES: uroporphyrinogen-III C-methyltransferase [Aneurinibacillus]AMA74092.1 uroporphyrin-III methyltransferase [Aneurinibacillus sp. XH2]MED0675468.1 uroporphyrinogen-III C-methyltransferase [Aneurinibacillus thermoaerophilus]MED0678823.1 uroporphyrinogen-III C-methyltransferase [Aneurinibacillus thermoaerophilus]MED0765227.1 uroporphyrinogen-III C-methyltransferase [Aneurinibacillus thermoaerophilus]SDH16411.1 uroporphyrin-III C-methyltransferase [Aneurinibacillus thermoaerophilus]
MVAGKVYLVGAGPGDPKLITVRGLELLQRADVIVYDRLASPKLLDYAKKEAECIYCGKETNHHSLSQTEINEIIVAKAVQGKEVVRLKGGDPFVFGRGGEEAEACIAAGIDYEVVPGITSGIAAPAYAGIPITHRGYSSSVAFVTGHKAVEKEQSGIQWEKLATAVDTLVFYMGVGNLPEIVKNLHKYGRAKETPVALIRWGTCENQETLIGTLETIVEQVQQARFRSPAVIVVGEVVRLREQLAWYEQQLRQVIIA